MADPGRDREDTELVDAIAARLLVVNQRIESAGGDPDRTSVIGVTKRLSIEVARAGVDAGIVDLGENYAQELVAKASTIDRAGVKWHMVGNIQRNKVKKLAPHVSLWQTVDRIEIGTAIASRAPAAAVLVQVNTTAESQKSGCEPAAVECLVDDLRGEGLDVRGLMTVGPTDPAADPRPSFSMLRELAEGLGLRELSMGMTADLEAAVAEGSTMVRVGTALFGPRPA